jgi:hypothetical protein
MCWGHPWWCSLCRAGLSASDRRRSRRAGSTEQKSAPRLRAALGCRSSRTTRAPSPAVCAAPQVELPSVLPSADTHTTHAFGTIIIKESAISPRVFYAMQTTAISSRHVACHVAIASTFSSFPVTAQRQAHACSAAGCLSCELSYIAYIVKQLQLIHDAVGVLRPEPRVLSSTRAGGRDAGGGVVAILLPVVTLGAGHGVVRTVTALSDRCP